MSNTHPILGESTPNFDLENERSIHMRQELVAAALQEVELATPGV